MVLRAWGPRRFFYERDLRLHYPKLRAFAKTKPQGSEAEVNARLDGKTREFWERETAMQWGGMPLSVFHALPEIERAQMIAHIRIRGMLEAHASKVQQDVAEKNSGKNPGGGSVPIGDFRPGKG